MEQLKNITTYKQFEQQFEKELTQQAESFVRVGYLLKMARDSDILAESGYRNVAEFAKEKYGLTKDVVSRYIKINDRFSEYGYSENLAEQYRGFGYAKLAIMLTLPDSIVDALEPEMSKSLISEVQKEVKEEQKITPLEVMVEQPVQEQLKLNDLQKWVHQYGYENRDKVKALVDAAGSEKYIEEIMAILAPGGVAVIPVRVKGRGKLMLSLKGKEKQPVLLDVRQERNIEYLWEELRDDIQLVYKEGTEKSWEETYGEEFKKDKGEKQDVGQISGRGIEEQPIVKVKALTEELKDKLFKKWFECVSSEKIEAACKQMTHMRFNELINITPRKLFLLVQTSQVSTEEIIEDSQIITKVEDNECTGEFSIQDFQKRFNREYLEPYKERMKELQEKKEAKQSVAPVQLEKEETDEGIALLSECVYEIIKKYREKLIGLTEFTEETVKNALDATTEQVPWLEFDVDGIRCEARVDLLGISKMKDLVVYKGNDTEEYVWTLDEVYKEIADVLNCDEEALQEEQIPGQRTIEDYPELMPDNEYKSIAVRALPGDKLYMKFINEIVEVEVEKVTIERSSVLIEVRATDPNLILYKEIDQEEWMTTLFPTREAAERVLQVKC